MDPLPNDLITISEAAELLGYGGSKPVAGVLHLIARGNLTAYPAGDAVRGRGYYPTRRLVSRAEVAQVRERRRSQMREALAKLEA